MMDYTITKIKCDYCKQEIDRLHPCLKVFSKNDNTHSSSAFSIISLLPSIFIFNFSLCKNGNCESSASLVCTYMKFLPWLFFCILPDPSKVILPSLTLVIYKVLIITILLPILINNHTQNITMNIKYNHTHNNYECKNETCGFKNPDLEEFKDHIESHKRKEYIASQAIENTQGLIKSDLLLEVI